MSNALNEKQVIEGLKQLLETPTRWAHEGRKLIFWYDPEAAFEALFDELELAGAAKLKLNHTPFYTKYKLLIEEPNSNYVLYAAYPQPPDKENWLLDLELTGNYYSADQAAMIQRDFGFYSKKLEFYIRDHLAFFNSKRRYGQLQDMGLAKDCEEHDLRLGMMSALVGLKLPDASLLIRRVLMAGLNELDNKVWQDLTKFFSEAEFWDVVKQSLNYASDKPSLRQLCICIAVTHMSRQLQSQTPDSLKAIELTRATQASVFMDSWLRDSEDSLTWQNLSIEIASDLGMQDIALELELSAYLEVETFKDFDEAFLRAMVLRLDTVATDFKALRAMLNRRKTLFWYERYEAYYTALEAATNFFEAMVNFEANESTNAVDLFNDYQTDFYKIDQAYRHYIMASDRVTGDILKQFDTQLEAAYTQRYLDALLPKWSAALVKEGSSWGFEGVEVQWQFYSRKILPFLASSERERAFVIVSDGLRFEVLEDLQRRLLTSLRGDATLTAMLGVLPSRTNFGMAALLPNKTLSISDAEQYVVFKDGLSTQGLSARQKILETTEFEAVALSVEALLKASRESGRETTKPYRLIYIYHDAIDNTGENAERDVFAACEKTINDLLNLISRIVNSFNGSNVFLTTDHGFLYQRKELEEADKITIHSKADLFEVKRRHALGTDAHAPLGSVGFDLPYLEGNLKAYAPNANQRYALQGSGANYVHGGISPQEVILPLLHYKHIRASKGDDGPSQKVGVQVITNSKRVTNTLFNLRLLQQEAVAARRIALRISVGFYDEQENPVSTQVELELNKSSLQAPDREYIASLTIESSKVTRSGNYYLMIRDLDSLKIILKESWQINLAFTDDFGDF